MGKRNANDESYSRSHCFASYNDQQRHGLPEMQRQNTVPELRLRKEVTNMEKIYLSQFPGTKYRIEMVRESGKKEKNSSTEPLSNAQKVYQYLHRGLENKDREFFVSILVDTRNVPLGVNLVSIGGQSSSIVEPREVFKAAILASAASLILAHNHPSGDPKPSQSDIGVTKRLVEAGEILGIPVLDHIIVGRDQYYSLQEGGHM